MYFGFYNILTETIVPNILLLPIYFAFYSYRRLVYINYKRLITLLQI